MFLDGLLPVYYLHSSSTRVRHYSAGVGYPRIKFCRCRDLQGWPRFHTRDRGTQVIFSHRCMHRHAHMPALSCSWHVNYFAKCSSIRHMHLSCPSAICCPWTLVLSLHYSTALTRLILELHCGSRLYCMPSRSSGHRVTIVIVVTPTASCITPSPPPTTLSYLCLTLNASFQFLFSLHAITPSYTILTTAHTNY